MRSGPLPGNEDSLLGWLEACRISGRTSFLSDKQVLWGLSKSFGHRSGLRPASLSGLHLGSFDSGLMEILSAAASTGVSVGLARGFPGTSRSIPWSSSPETPVAAGGWDWLLPWSLNSSREQKDDEQPHSSEQSWIQQGCHHGNK